MSKNSLEEAKSDMKMWVSNGWNLKEETKTHYLLSKNTQTFGMHIIIYIIMALMMSQVAGGSGSLMAFVGNIVYFFVSRKEKKIMK